MLLRKSDDKVNTIIIIVTIIITTITVLLISVPVLVDYLLY